MRQQKKQGIDASRSIPYIFLKQRKKLIYPLGPRIGKTFSWMPTGRIQICSSMTKIRQKEQCIQAQETASGKLWMKRRHEINSLPHLPQDNHSPRENPMFTARLMQVHVFGAPQLESQRSRRRSFAGEIFSTSKTAILKRGSGTEALSLDELVGGA